jgi:hypothetical protein
MDNDENEETTARAGSARGSTFRAMGPQADGQVSRPSQQAKSAGQGSRLVRLHCRSCCRGTAICGTLYTRQGNAGEGRHGGGGEARQG